MKKIFLVITCFYAATCLCQTNRDELDSFKAMLQHAKSDSARADIMDELSFGFMYYNADSSMYYAQQTLKLSKAAGYPIGIARGLNNIGNTLSNSGNYAKSIEIFLEALKKAEEMGKPRLQSTTLANIGEAYANQGDYPQAIKYAHRALAIDIEQGDKPFLVYDYLNLGDYYVKNNQPDTALFYENQAYQLNLLEKNSKLTGSILSSLGDIQARLGNDDIALPYFKKALAYSGDLGDNTDDSRTLIGLAEVYKRARQRDSAIFYLQKAYTKAREASFHDGMLKASGLLSQLYENVNSDSTLKYLKLNVAYKDSSFSAEKVKQVQSLTFAEQMRQQEMAEEKLRQAEDRWHNLQLIGIAAFIPLFFGVFLLLSRRTIHVSILRFFGLLGLLLLFEFISLLIHPYIMKWTNHAPVFMLILLVAIGSLLVPTHHWLEKWLNKKLGNKSVHK